MSRRSAPVLRAGVDPCQRNRAAGSKLVRERDGSSGVSLPGHEHGFKRRGVARSTTKHGIASSGLNTCGGKWEERPVPRLRLQEHRRTKLTRNLEPTKNSVDGAAAALFHTLAESSSPAPWNALTSAPISFFSPKCGLPPQAGCLCPLQVLNMPSATAPNQGAAGKARGFSGSSSWRCCAAQTPRVRRVAPGRRGSPPLEGEGWIRRSPYLPFSR